MSPCTRGQIHPTPSANLLHNSGKTLVFLTNNAALPALTIAGLYKSRWQIEESRR